MITLLSIHSIEYKPLADLTWHQNKKWYCEKYGYDGYNFEVAYRDKIGFDKYDAILTVMPSSKAGGWFWATGADTLITNFDIDIANLCDDNYSFIATHDCNGLNVDSILVRNDVYGQTLLAAVVGLQDIIEHSQYEQYLTDNLICANPFWGDRTKIINQWEMNSYDYKLYPACRPYGDLYNERGQWESGDLLVHWPGQNLEQRLALAKEYLTIVRR